MHNTLWRIACILAAAGGLAFGLWAGAAIVRSDAPVAPGLLRGGETLVNLRHVPIEASPAGPPRPRAQACDEPAAAPGSPRGACGSMPVR